MNDTATLLKGDLTFELFAQFGDSGRIAWDIETSGLDWASGEIGTCQLHNLVVGTVIVQSLAGQRPVYLGKLLSDESVVKVFHHAPFDLRWMSSHWNITPASIACTKVASRLLNRDANSQLHSLKHLLHVYLGIEIDKTERTSDWLSGELTMEQLAYAASDVVNLLPLHDVLEKELQSAGLYDLYQQCKRFLPTLVALDVGGWPDVFSY